MARNSADRHLRKTVSFRLPVQLMARLRRLAGSNRRTLSGEVQVALENHLAQAARRNGPKQGRTPQP
jgi:predicted DNA-binding protein